MKTTSLPISLWAKTQSFLFPTRSSLVKEPEAVASAAAFPSAAKRELTPPGPACQQLFFRTPKIFSERAARVSPRRRSGNLSRPLLAVNCFLLLFSKNLFAPPSRPLGPARLSETFRPAAAKTVYAPPRRLCQRLFIFFLIFLPHTPRFYRVFAPVRAPKNCTLKFPLKNIRLCLQKAALSAFGQ